MSDEGRWVLHNNANGQWAKINVKPERISSKEDRSKQCAKK